MSDYCENFLPRVKPAHHCTALRKVFMGKALLLCILSIQPKFQEIDWNSEKRRVQNQNDDLSYMYVVVYRIKFTKKVYTIEV